MFRDKSRQKKANKAKIKSGVENQSGAEGTGKCCFEVSIMTFSTEVPEIEKEVGENRIPPKLRNQISSYLAGMQISSDE